MSYLLVSNEDPVVLDGYIDIAGLLQIRHDSDNLVNYDQEIWCQHDTNYSITLEIHDFVHDSVTWTVSAEHERTAWTRASDHVYFTFTTEPSSPFQVEITATDGSTSKQRTIASKPQPRPPSLLSVGAQAL